MYPSRLPRTLGQFSLIVALAASSPAVAQSGADAATDAALPLSEYVVSATRTPQDLRSIASAVSVVNLADVALSQFTELGTVLASEPGVTVVSTGPRGGQTSVFLRGANSHHTLWVVDGVRMSDRAASYTNFLGAADLAGVDRLEILRGPQSTLYGSSAIGGVILVEQFVGTGGFAGSLSALGGSFETWGAAVAARGTSGTFGYTAQVARFETANDQPDNGLESWSYATRLESQVTEALTIGGTFRGVSAEFEETGSIQFPSPGVVESENYLGTVYAEATVSETVRSRLTVAQHARRYEFTAPWGVSEQRNRRWIADWLNTWTPSDRAELVAGANYEQSKYWVSGDRTSDQLVAGYVSTTLRPTDEITVNAGARHDDFDSFGDATTWRLGAAWNFAPATKLRATIGTGFSAPGSDDRFGVPAWGQLPNPDLAAEKSRGWDVGIDHVMADGRWAVSATYFHNRFRNLFEWELVDFTTFTGRIVNRTRATTEGAEFAAVWRPVDTWRVRVAYTYLEAEDRVTGERLIRRPRHAWDGEIRWQPTARFSVGGGGHFVGDRTDVGVTMDDYSTVRLFGSYELRDDVSLRVRVENALDESYQEVLGYPALPRGVFGSVEWRF